MPDLITELTRRNVIRGAVGLGSLATLSLETGDELSLYLENTGGSADLDVEKLALTV